MEWLQLACSSAIGAITLSACAPNTSSWGRAGTTPATAPEKAAPAATTLGRPTASMATVSPTPTSDLLPGGPVGAAAPAEENKPRRTQSAVAFAEASVHVDTAWPLQVTGDDRPDVLGGRPAGDGAQQKPDHGSSSSRSRLWNRYSGPASSSGQPGSSDSGCRSPRQSSAHGRKGTSPSDSQSGAAPLTSPPGRPSAGWARGRARPAASTDSGPRAR